MGKINKIRQVSKNPVKKYIKNFLIAFLLLIVIVYLIIDLPKSNPVMIKVFKLDIKSDLFIMRSC